MTELVVNVSKVINAPIEDSFDAWLDADSLASFMLPKAGMSNPTVITDPRPGGSFEIVMDTGNDKIPHRGIYQTIDRPNLLAFTWNSPFSAEDSVVTIAFEVVDGTRTRITLTHEKFPNQESRDNHEAGWMNILASLDKRLSSISTKKAV